MRERIFKEKIISLKLLFIDVHSGKIQTYNLNRLKHLEHYIKNNQDLVTSLQKSK